MIKNSERLDLTLKAQSHDSLVSVIMPTYNCLSYLPSAIDSVLAQGVSFELLIVDDGSTDGSDIWLAEQAKKDPRIKVIKGEHKGVSAARNLAIKVAQGDWIAFLDADDFWYKRKLKAQLETVYSNPNCVMNFTEYDHLDEQGVDLGRCFHFWPRFSALLKGVTTDYAMISGKDKTCVYEENIIGTSTVLVKTRAIREVGGFDETLFSASDWDLWLKLSNKGDLSVIKYSTTHYLVRSNSISRNQQRRLKSMLCILERYKPSMETLNPYCYTPAFARFKLAEAEALQGQPGGYWPAVLSYIQACYRLPTKRNFRACLSHFVYGLWRHA
ncbi:glycosyltransferase family 2 protein [Marinomonas algicola]|uniref:glycosyltransferase family 2 protein n=1 Tax=Marinomonas algicola TaxID=2773454 RepID=UPI00174D95CB|nr:glycosyltransferase family A protein [Marinomonas algicola]